VVLHHLDSHKIFFSIFHCNLSIDAHSHGSACVKYKFEGKHLRLPLLHATMTRSLTSKAKASHSHANHSSDATGGTTATMTLAQTKRARAIVKFKGKTDEEILGMLRCLISVYYLYIMQRFNSRPGYPQCISISNCLKSSRPTTTSSTNLFAWRELFCFISFFCPFTFAF
jgi:hypothetical protein